MDKEYTILTMSDPIFESKVKEMNGLWGGKLHTNIMEDDKGYTVLLKGKDFDPEDEPFVEALLCGDLADHALRCWMPNIITKKVKKLIHESDKKINLENAVKEAERFYISPFDSVQECLLMRGNRVNKIGEGFREAVKSGVVDVEYILRFNCKPQVLEMELAAELGCEQVKNDEEYSEFVNLLRYFVSTQPSKVDEIHIERGDNKFGYVVTETNGDPAAEDLISYYLDDVQIEDYEADDVLVSALITMSPKRVVLHDIGKGDKGWTSVEIIKQVFDDMIIDCIDNCKKCSNKCLRGGGKLPKVVQPAHPVEEKMAAQQGKAQSQQKTKPLKTKGHLTLVK